MSTSPFLPMSSREIATAGIVPGLTTGHLFWDIDASKNVPGSFFIVGKDREPSVCFSVKEGGSSEDELKEYFFKPTAIFFQTNWGKWDAFAELSFNEQLDLKRRVVNDRSMVASVKNIPTVALSPGEESPKVMYISAANRCDFHAFPISKRVISIPASSETSFPLVVFATLVHGELMPKTISIRTKHEWGMLPKAMPLTKAISSAVGLTIDDASDIAAKQLQTMRIEGENAKDAPLERLKIAVSSTFHKKEDKLEAHKYLITLYRKVPEDLPDPSSTYAKVNYLIDGILQEFIIPAYRIMVMNPDGSLNLMSHFSLKGQNEVLATAISSGNELTIPMPTIANRVFQVLSRTKSLDTESKLLLRSFTTSELMEH